MIAALDDRPVIVAVAGPNGAGKTTFYEAFLRFAGLRYLSADVITDELRLDPYTAAAAVAEIRRALLEARESFVFETVFSDPIGEKLDFLIEACAAGVLVVVLFIGVSGPDVSEQRVSMRVAQGGHDVPTSKLGPRFSRSLKNLERAIRQLPHVLIFDNDDLSAPYRRVAIFDHGRPVELARELPAWLVPLVPITDREL